MVYTPDADFIGSDGFVIAVTDARDATGEVSIDVTVVEANGNSGNGVSAPIDGTCGCAAAGGGGGGLLLLLVGLLGMRRRS